MQRCIDAAHEAGVRHVMLHVTVDNTPAVRLCEYPLMPMFRCGTPGVRWCSGTLMEALLARCEDGWLMCCMLGADQSLGFLHVRTEVAYYAGTTDAWRMVRPLNYCS